MSYINKFELIFMNIKALRALRNSLPKFTAAVLYNEKFVNAGIVDYGHLINSAGEILNYDRVTKKFDIPPNKASFIEFY